MHIRFQMTDQLRQRYIAEHNFYVEQASLRLLSQFNNIENEAEEYGEQWLSDAGQNFNPNHDPGAYYEQASDEIIDFALKLYEMRNRTRLSVVAGIFHEWDKQLRSWLINEIKHWHRGDNVEKAIWGKNFSEIFDLLETFGYSMKTQGYYLSLDRCRLVVNAYKHGHGGSFDAIKKLHPEFIETFGATEPAFLEYADHDALRVTDAHITEFSQAIIKFWECLPTAVFEDKLADLPKWFQNARIKDNKNEGTKQ